MLGEPLIKLPHFRRLRRPIRQQRNRQPRPPQFRDPPPCHRRIRIRHRHNNLRHPRLNHRPGARRRPPPMATRLQRNVQRRPPGARARLLQRHHLGVRLPRRLRRPPPHHAPILHHRRPHRRVGASAAQRLPRQLDGLTHKAHRQIRQPP